MRAGVRALRRVVMGTRVCEETCFGMAWRARGMSGGMGGQRRDCRYLLCPGL